MSIFTRMFRRGPRDPDDGPVDGLDIDSEAEEAELDPAAAARARARAAAAAAAAAQAEDLDDEDTDPGVGSGLMSAMTAAESSRSGAASTDPPSSTDSRTTSTMLMTPLAREAVASARSQSRSPRSYALPPGVVAGQPLRRSTPSSSPPPESHDAAPASNGEDRRTLIGMAPLVEPTSTVISSSPRPTSALGPPPSASGSVAGPVTLPGVTASPILAAPPSSPPPGAAPPPGSAPPPASGGPPGSGRPGNSPDVVASTARPNRPSEPPAPTTSRTTTRNRVSAPPRASAPARKTATQAARTVAQAAARSAQMAAANPPARAAARADEKSTPPPVRVEEKSNPPPVRVEEKSNPPVVRADATPPVVEPTRPQQHVDRVTTQADREELRALFTELAGHHMVQLRDFMIEVRCGSALADWIGLSEPAVRSVRGMAEQLELDDICAALDRLLVGLGIARQAGGAVSGEHQASLLAAYMPLVELLPGVLELDSERNRREPIIVHSLLRQVPGMEKVAIDKLVAANLVSVSALADARPMELAQVTGLPLELAERVVSRFRAYRERAGAVATPDPRAELRALSELLARLRQETENYDAAAASWAPAMKERKRELRRGRAETLLAIHVSLARLGEVDRLVELDRLNFRRKFEFIESYLKAARAARARTGGPA